MTTVTWRDTLYLWRGKLVIEKQNRDAEESKQGDASLTWIGTRINVAECPDARAAAIPTGYAFESSSSKFNLSGTIQEPVSSASVISLTGGTWQHAGEGGHVDDETSSPKSDVVHQLDLSRWLKDPRPFRRSLVLGSGSNEYGDFIEMGWMNHGGIFRLNLLDDDGKREGTLTLARRYLPPYDERSSWTFNRMFSEMKLGIPPLIGEDIWTTVAEFLDSHHYFIEEAVAPWQAHAIMHSARYITMRGDRGALVKVGNGPACLVEGAPSLKTPTTDGTPFQLCFVSPSDGGDPIPNTLWIRQCWGCGGSGVQNELDFDCRHTEFDAEYLVTKPYPWLHGEFCSKQCVHAAIPQLAQVTAEWKQGREGLPDAASTNRTVWLSTLQLEESSFWECVEEDDVAVETMTNAGWARSPSDGWVLKLA